MLAGADLRDPKRLIEVLSRSGEKNDWLPFWQIGSEAWLQVLPEPGTRSEIPIWPRRPRSDIDERPVSIWSRDEIMHIEKTSRRQHTQLPTEFWAANTLAPRLVCPRARRSYAVDTIADIYQGSFRGPRWGSPGISGRLQRNSDRILQIADGRSGLRNFRSVPRYNWPAYSKTGVVT